MGSRIATVACCLGFMMGFSAVRAVAQQADATVPLAIRVDIDIEQPPFAYSDTKDENRVTRMIDKIKSKELKLEYSREHGYLRSILAALEISESSQTLVFSKTSMQVSYISRLNPRAIYFNEDTYVGWVRSSSLMEISTDDPKLGAVFYTVDMMPWRAKVERVDYDCLGCHATSLTQGVPGHTVRSVLPTIDGSVNVQRESFTTDHSRPFSQRWGGWYVTGRHGDMKHMGNAVLRGESLDTADNGNRLSLRHEFDTFDYLSPDSDIVALMVLEHQSQTHNTMTRADFTVRQLQYERSQLEKTAETEAEWRVQISLLAREIVDDLLFCSEAPLTSEVKGSLVFAESFTARGPKESQGRSLREFDLQTRMFKYACSYLIYSPSFGSLSDELRNQVISQLTEILEARDVSPHYAHLTPDMRQVILEILRDTHPDFKNRS